MATTIASDDFNRADGDVGANWTALTAAGSATNKPDVSSNKLKPQASGEDEVCYYSASNFDMDQFSQATFSTVTTASYTGLAIRCTKGDTATEDDYLSYEKNATNTSQIVNHYDNGIYRTLGSYAGGFSNGDVLRVEAEGCQIRCYQNGVLRITVNDVDVPTYRNFDQSGLLYPGVKFAESATTNERIDDWSGGNLYETNRIRAFQEGSTRTAVASFNEAFNIDSQDNSSLYVVVGTRDATAADLPVSSMTFNGDAMTRVRQDLWNSATFVKTEIWKLPNPDIGNNTIAVTLTGTCAFARIQFYHIMGNDQTTPVEVNDGTDGASGAGATTISQSITTVTANAILMDSFWEKDNIDPTVGTGMIIYGATSPNSGDDRYRNSIRRVGAPGSYAMAYTWTNTDGYALSVAGLRPFLHPAPFASPTNTPLNSKTEVVEY